MQQTHVFRLADGLPICKSPDILDQKVEKLAQQLISTKELSGKFEKYYFLKRNNVLFVSSNANLLEPLADAFKYDDINLLAQPYQYQHLSQIIKNTRPVDFVQASFDKLSQEVQISKQLAEQNLSQVLERGQKLNDIETITSELAEGSKNIFGVATKLDRAAFLRKYGTVATVCGFMLLLLLLKIFW
ncbi:Synaptobrevin [Spironucleus salmonicida]|uniref:Synaptobrevin n=1 Tax=Spironucleus salmonicida TaxID=348837 RepID=V6LYX3_9EUKA|nr:Synaptobrevin [Spironucleus salmonicida]|eukprot:EST46029.1 Synaptobrevin [Spironucleus salmonicida]